MRDRTEYAKQDTDALVRMYRSAEDRSTRACTTAAYMADAFQMQEIGSVLTERGVKEHYRGRA